MKKLLIVLSLLLFTFSSYSADVCSIYNAFDKNALAAEQAYGGWQTITGYVSEVGYDLFGNLQLTLGCENSDFNWSSVVISMNDSEKSKMMYLQPGQRVSVKAKFSGKIIFPFYENGQIL